MIYLMVHENAPNVHKAPAAYLPKESEFTECGYEPVAPMLTIIKEIQS